MGVAGLADTGASLEVGNFTASQTTVVNESFTDRTPGPSPLPHGEISVKVSLAHPTPFWLDAQE